MPMVRKVSLILTLKPGDRVELVAPSSAISGDDIKKSIKLLKSWELVPHVQPFWESTPPHPLYSNEDELRFKDLSLALSSSHSKAVWVLRGGCGATRLIPRLFEWSRSLASVPPPKLLIGFSDVTALHTFLIQEWNWPTLHAPNLRDLVAQRVTPSSMQALKDILLGYRKAIEETDLIPLNDLARQHAIIEAPLVGGNHSVLQYSIGTSWQLDCRGKILFLEDVNEQAYRIAERLEHFLQAGLFNGVEAILFGDYSYTPEHTPEDPSKLEYVLKYFAAGVSVPVFKMPGYGHDRVNKPLFMGKMARLETSISSHLKI
jgi:muramoyltetrapeptide carboxypeptidase